MNQVTDKYGKLKGFRLPPELNERFVNECKTSNVSQSIIIELLIVRWLKLRSEQDKKFAKIYPTTH